VKLTDTKARSIPAPKGDYLLISVDGARGLTLRITAPSSKEPKGARSWVFTYRPKTGGGQRRMTIGRVESWPLKAAKEEAGRLRRIVDDLLWLARFEATPRSGKAEPVDVGVMAQQAVDRFAAVAESRHQRLSVRLSGDSHVIAASPEWLDHLVGVLLDNACKYTPEQGSIDVRVAAEGNRIKLVVDDSGPGIPRDQRGQIFDRFRRVSDQPGGSGLGLAIADAVVRATNGRWEVSTAAAGGASMAVTWARLFARPSATRAAASETPPPLARLDA